MRVRSESGQHVGPRGLRVRSSRIQAPAVYPVLAGNRAARVLRNVRVDRALGVRRVTEAPRRGEPATPVGSRNGGHNGAAA